MDFFIPVMTDAYVTWIEELAAMVTIGVIELIIRNDFWFDLKCSDDSDYSEDEI